MLKLTSYIIFFILLGMSVYGQKKGVDITFESEFNIKNSSIRAIEVLNDASLWFAGSNGRYGRIVDDQIEIDSISYEGRMPNFRSIASNGKHIFLLSIENPALLFKINPMLPLGEVQLVYKESHPDVFYDALTFFDETHGIAMGDPLGGCLSILTSSDSGDHWHKIPCEDLPEVTEGEAAFAASNTNIATFENKAWIATGGKKARVFFTKNYGKSWQVSETPLIQGGKMTGIFTIDFYNRNVGMIMGGNWEEKTNTNASKAISIDGGQSWSLVGTDAIPGYISCVQFVPKASGDEIMAVSTAGIYYSNDTGATWIKLSERGFYSLRFATDKTAWLSSHERITKIKIKK